MNIMAFLRIKTICQTLPLLVKRILLRIKNALMSEH
jgi:hypothetical protein